MNQNKIEHLASLAPQVDFFSLRLMSSCGEEISYRHGVMQPLRYTHTKGLMVTVHHEGAIAYAATADLSDEAVKAAFDKAKMWALQAKDRFVLDSRELKMPTSRGQYETPVQKPWGSWSISDKMAYLRKINDVLKKDPRIVDSDVYLSYEREEHSYLASNGAQTQQSLHLLMPWMSAVANEGTNTQTRSLGGLRATCRQGGLEILETLRFEEQAERVREEAIQLLLAPNCPSGEMDLILAPDQMMLQIHESIGHPLELDRILGDERNYAGTSFVTMDMFGQYKYGSPLLNITYDPTLSEEFASFRYDDEGLEAQKTYLIQDGILQRPLGSTLSQARAKMAGVANARACSWNRPPIDRMANLNLEPGKSSVAQMIASVEKGILMESNVSWSIDDSRNKFQFGCEFGQLIENGKLTQVVRNPNYRGVSANFWQSLQMVGDRESFGIFGTPYCGKGEPNQCVRVGHASPHCLFSQVDVFGGE